MATTMDPPAARDAAPAGTSDDETAYAEPVVLTGDQLIIRELVINGAPAAAVRHCVEQGGDAADTVRQMLDIGGAVLQHGANSTLVQAVIAEMRSEGVTQESLRLMTDRMSAKGVLYEDQVRPVLEAAFAPYGDEVDDLSGTPGHDRKSKKGDFVATLNPESIGGRDRRVVIEAKDQPTTRLRGKDGALSYLAAAMENRQAAAGVFVCATAVPALAGSRLRVYPGNRILVRYDKDEADALALEVACQLARSIAARALGDEDGLSTRLVTEKIERLREVIEQAREIHGGALEAKRGIKRVDAAYDKMRTEALAIIYELDDRLAE